MNDDTTTAEHFSRRGALARLAAGALGVGAFGARELLDPDAASAGPAAVASGLVSCVLAPEQTDGPYYVDGAAVRRNVTEGKPGTTLMLRLTVVSASTCKPIKGASVEIWHCDAGGVYSGTSQQGTESERFLRGVQRTDAKGLAIFRTIYPGWYSGRAVHIHTKVHVGGNVVHTGQLYFSDAVTDAVYKRTPYSSRPNRDPRNSGDSIFRHGGKRSQLKVVKSGSSYAGSIVMGVVRS